MTVWTFWLTTDSGTLTKYLNGSDIDNKLRIQTGSSVNYFLTDHLGSTNGLADSSGNLTASTRYDSFGNATGNLTTRYQYTGREYDSFTGLYYYRARWYDSNLGRFISEDPIGFAGGDVNLFGYVKNNPSNRRDPRGYADTEGENDGSVYVDNLRVPIVPKKPECGPAGQPFLEWLVVDRAGPLVAGGLWGYGYNFTPACAAHDSCYETCGNLKQQCDFQLGRDVGATCLQSSRNISDCVFYAALYQQGVHWGAQSAYQSAQEGSGCIPCSLPYVPPPRVYQERPPLPPHLMMPK